MTASRVGSGPVSDVVVELNFDNRISHETKDKSQTIITTVSLACLKVNKSKFLFLSSKM